MTSLKRSRSRNRTRDRPRVALGPGQRVLEPVEEQRPVGQPGQRVVQGLVGQLVLGALALDHAAELGADLAHDLAQRLVGLQRLGREELQDGGDLAADQHGEGEGGGEPAGAGGIAAREVVIGGDVGDPAGCLGRQHAPGQAGARLEAAVQRRLAERQQPLVVGVGPDVERDQVAAVVLDGVDVADGPAGVLGDLVQGHLEGLPAARGLVGGDAHPLQQLDEAGLAGEGLLGALALGDVAEDPGEELAVALGPVRQRQLDGELAAVLAQRVHLDGGADDPRLRGQQEAAHAALVGVAVALRHEHGQRLAEDVGLLVAEDGLAAPVPADDVAPRVGGHDGVVGRFRHGTELHLELLQRGLGLLALGDVGEPEDGDRRAVVLHQRAEVVHGELAAVHAGERGRAAGRAAGADGRAERAAAVRAVAARWCSSCTVTPASSVGEVPSIRAAASLANRHRPSMSTA